MTVKIKYLLLLVVLVVLLLPYLTRVPTPYIDEMWHIDTGWNFVNSGNLAPTPFGNIAGINRISFQPPVFNILMGWWLGLFGLGMFQARLLVVVMAALILLLTYLIGKILYDEKTAMVSATLVFFWCYIVFRYVRYDIAVALFFLIGFYLFLLAEKGEHKAVLCLLSGLSCGLASISHLYGGIGALAILVLFFIKHRFKLFSRREVWFFILGLAVPLAVYAAYMYPYRELIAKQLQLFAPGRYSLLSPAFYMRNIATEVQRWSHPFSLAFVCSVLFFFWVYRKELKAHLKVLAVILTFLVFFTLFVQVKTFVYALVVCPFIAICVSVVWLNIWQRLTNKLRVPSRASQCILVILLLLLVAVRPVRVLWKVWYKYGVGKSNYTTYLEEISRYIPENSIVLSQYGYWLGFTNNTFYSEFLVTIMKNNYGIDFSQAVKALGVEYLVIDETFLHYQQDPDIPSFLEKECLLVGSVTNELYSNFPGYGTEHDGVTRIYSVKQR